MHGPAHSQITYLVLSTRLIKTEILILMQYSSYFRKYLTTVVYVDRRCHADEAETEPER